MPLSDQVSLCKKGPLNVTPKEKGPISPSSLGPQRGPPKPQGMTPTVHPSNATQAAQQGAATPAGPVLCQGSSALAGDPLLMGAPWESSAGSRGCPQGVGTGAAQEMGRGDPGLSTVTSSTASAPRWRRHTHIHPPAHTGAPFRGCSTPAPPGERSRSCQRGLQAPGAAGCGPAGQGQ